MQAFLNDTYSGQLLFEICLQIDMEHSELIYSNCIPFY